MTSGWAVRVSFIFGGQVVDDGQPLYYAAFSDPGAAVGAIRRCARLSPAEAQVEAVEPVGPEVIGALKLREGAIIRRR